MGTCNHCDLKRLKKRAKKSKQKVVQVRACDGSVSVYVDGLFRVKYINLPLKCVCHED